MDRHATSPRVGRSRSRGAGLRKRALTKQAIQRSIQRADRQSFIFRWRLMRDITDYELEASNWKRVEELGGPTLKEAKAAWMREMTDLMHRTNGSTDPRYQMASVHINAKYNVASRMYEHEERVERTVACNTADAALQSYKADSEPLCINKVLEHLDSQVFERCEQEIEKARRNTDPDGL